jgi:hypothetical protein
MSRSYRIDVKISDYDPARAEAIKEAAEEEWPFEDWTGEAGEPLTCQGDDQLRIGVTEEEFTVELSKAVWRANGAYCRVMVNALYLDELPYESHSLDQSDYARLMPGND